MELGRVLVCLGLCAVWHVGPTFGQSQIDMNVLARLEHLEKQVSGQQYQLDVQNKLIANLQTRVTDQESAIAKQQTTINEQQTTIIAQQKTVTEQQKTISEQQNEIAKHQSNLYEQNRRLTRLEGILMVYRTGNGNWTGPQMDAEGANNAQQNEVTDDATNARTEPAEADKDQVKLKDRGTAPTRRLNRRLVLGSGSAVAFHAVNAQTTLISHVTPGQRITFPTVRLNLGAGYHNLHGLFIAPAAGLYIFSTSIMSYVNAHPGLTVSMMKNGAVLARAFAHGDSGGSDQGSVTVVTQLAIGDEVWVSESYDVDASYWGNSYTSFTGCLLWSL